MQHSILISFDTTSAQQCCIYGMIYVFCTDAILLRLRLYFYCILSAWGRSVGAVVVSLACAVQSWARPTTVQSCAAVHAVVVVSLTCAVQCSVGGSCPAGPASHPSHRSETIQATTGWWNAHEIVKIKILICQKIYSEVHKFSQRVLTFWKQCVGGF